MDDVSEDTPTMRAADNDRQAIVEHLARAQAEGRLDLTEFDDRVHRAWTAQTYADLAVLITDLPRDAPVLYHPPQEPALQPALQPVHQPEPAKPNKAARFVYRAWVAATMINFVIWGLVSISSLELVYPWWIWVAGPWGALLLAARVTRFGQPR